jgi:hypothetical protein
MKGLNVVFVDANFLAPLVEEIDPIAEASDFCYFSWHEVTILSPQRRSVRRECTGSILDTVPS